MNQGKLNRPIVELPGLSVVGGDNDAIRRLDRWTADVPAMPVANAAPSRCTPTEVLAAIAFSSANVASRVQ